MNDNPDNLFTAARPAVTPYQGRLSVIPIFRAFRVLISAILIFSCAAPARAATRVVLVSTGARATGKNLLTLAEAKVSALADIQLLERRQLDLVLQEQHLALEEWVDSKSAVKIGRLLHADVIANIESAPDKGESSSFVVFDAGSGARLWDATLPPGLESAVTAITQGVQTSVRKLQLPPTSRHVVSVLTVRNADLPRALDQFCAAVGQLLERNLTGNPNFIVLERSCLERLNQERELLTTRPVTNNLLSTIVQLQVDIGRATNGSGLQGMILWSGPATDQVQRVSAQITGENAVELANALAAAVYQKLAANASPPHANSLRKLEAQQFSREASLRRYYKETAAAWRAVEAAHALDPDEIAIESQLMCYLFDEGSQRPLPEALEFGIRSLSFRETRLRNALNTADRERMWAEEAREQAAIAALTSFVRNIARLARNSPDPVVREKYSRFAKQFLTMDWDRFEAWAQLTRKDPREFTTFTKAITSDHAIPACYFLTETEFVTRLDQYLHRWLEVANLHPPTTDSLDAIRDLMQRIRAAFHSGVTQAILGITFNFQPEHFEKLKPVAQAMADSPSPVISAEGKEFLTFLTASVTNRPVNFATSTALMNQLRTADNKFAGLFTNSLTQVKTEPPTPAVETSKQNSIQAPWSKPIRLFDVSQFPELDAFLHVLVDGDTVYGLGIRNRNQNGAPPLLVDVYLVRASLTDGEARIVNHGILTNFVSGPASFIPHVELDHSNLMLLVNNQPSKGSRGVFAMSVDGKSVVRIDEKWNLPNQEIDCFTVLGNQMFIGLQGYLVQCDLDSKQTEVLASSRRADKRTELDNGELFKTRFMIPDPKRGRIIVGVDPSDADHDFHTTLWSFTITSGQLTNLVSFRHNYHTGVANRLDGDSVVISDPFGTAAFHLDTGRMEMFGTIGAAYSRAVKENDQMVLGLFRNGNWGEGWGRGPMFIRDGYIWSASARFSLAGKQVEFFPVIRPPVQDASKSSLNPHISTGNPATPQFPFCFVPIANSRNLLLGAAAGAWLLPLSEGGTNSIKAKDSP